MTRPTIKKTGVAKSTTFTFYQYDRADVEQLNNLILNTDWNNIFHDGWPIDRVLDTFTEIFFCHINQCIPKVTKRRKFKPWFSSDLKRMSTKKQNAYHKAKRTNSDVDLDAYRTLNNQFTYAKKQAYNSHWEVKFAKNDNLKSFWSFVRAQRAEPDSLSFVINDNQTSILLILLMVLTNYSQVILQILIRSGR